MPTPPRGSVHSAAFERALCLTHVELGSRVDIVARRRRCRRLLTGWRRVVPVDRVVGLVESLNRLQLDLGDVLAADALQV